MKIVAIVGSPRRGGNTEILTRIALEEIHKQGLDTELVSLAGKTIAPCDACASCRRTGKCHVKDDFETIYSKMNEADGIILATPVFFGAATPQMASLISRCYAYVGTERPFENKVGGPIVVASCRPQLHPSSTHVLLHDFRNDRSRLNLLEHSLRPRERRGYEGQGRH